MAFVLLLTAVVGYSACTPLRPSDGSVRVEAQVLAVDGTLSLKVDKKSLGNSLRPGYLLRVQVFRLERRWDGGEVCAQQEGGDKELDLSGPQDTVTLDRLEVGRKEIQVSVISDLEDRVGYGSLRMSVALGLNEIREPLRIDLIPDELRRRDWNLKFNLSFIKPGTENEVLYSEVQPSIYENCAKSCHNAAAAKAGLDMATFPFTSSNPVLATQDDIVRESIYAMQDFTYPMPPSPDPRVSDPDIAKIQAWYDSGLPISRSTADQLNHLVEVVKLQWKSLDSSETGEITVAKRAEMEFGAVMRSVRIGSQCDLTVVVLGPGGVELGRKEFKSQLVWGVRDYSEEVRIKYEQPRVTIPIVISQP